jgi:hypothetical protein
MNVRNWGLIGPVAAATYTVTVVVGGAITPGYSHTRDHVSTLLQAGSENGLLLIPPFLAYNLLTMAAGMVLVAIARRTTGRSAIGALAGAALVAEGMVGAATLAFPQDPIGATVTGTGLTHIVLAGLSSLLTMIAIALCGVWLLAQPGRRAVAWYSFVTVAVVFAGGAVTAIATANLDPLMGLYERIPIFGFVQWLFVAGFLLWRTSVPRARVQPAAA